MAQKKREQFLVWKVEIILKIPQRNKNQFSIDINPVFSSWVHVIKKAPVINCSRNSKLKGHLLFFEIRKLKFFQ